MQTLTAAPAPAAPLAAPAAARPRRRARWGPAAAVVLPWLGLGVLKAAEVYAQRRLRGEPGGYLQAFLVDLPIVLVGIAVTPPVLWLCARFPLTRRAWPRHLPVLAAAAVALVFAMNAARTWMWQLGGVAPDVGLLQATLLGLANVFHIDLTVLMLVGGIAHVAMHARERQAREVAAARLAAQLSEARLGALRMQLHPHFLFNSLHSVGQLVRAGRSAEAMEVVERLGDLLRASLDPRAAHLVPVRDDVEFARAYLEIERVRFSDRLRVEWRVDWEEVEGARVPHFLLQPLVENAIRHGIAPTSSAGRITVEIGGGEGRVRIAVRDDGPGLPKGGTAGGGVGLRNTRARLEQIYGTDFRFTVANHPAGGVEAAVELPRHPPEQPWAASAS